MHREKRERDGKPNVKQFSDSDKCRFCRRKIKEIDYKETAELAKLLTHHGKIFSRKRSGNCAFHQRSCKRALKRARYLSLLPYIS